VHQDLPPKLIDDIEAWCDPFLRVVDDLDSLLSLNRIFKAGNVGIDRVALVQASAWGFSGIRFSSSCRRDLRRSRSTQR
jgi:NADH-quinone oxidoreductase subunit D